MPDLRKTTTTTADEPKKAGCCDGDQDKHGKHQAALPNAPDKVKPTVHDAHKHDEGSDGGCCGGGKAAK